MSLKLYLAVTGTVNGEGNTVTDTAFQSVIDGNTMTTVKE